MNIEDLIPTGHAHAITRRELRNLTGMNDRQVRRAVQRMRSSYPVINMGYGYYIPDMDDPEDRTEAKAYLEIEKAKAREIYKGLQEVARALDGI